MVPSDSNKKYSLSLCEYVVGLVNPITYITEVSIVAWVGQHWTDT